MMQRLCLSVLLVCGGGALAQQRVDVPSLDAPQGAAVQLPGYWFAAPRGGRAPAWVLLHGCGGPYAGDSARAGGSRAGVLSARMREHAKLLNQHGMHVLVLDSFTPRDEKELCTQRTGQRRITQTQRRRDALGALAWLAARDDTDATRLGLIGWSNGGSTVLAATNANHAEVAAAAVRPSHAVAFYPGCVDDERRGYRPVAPLLLLLGAADDWTPIAPCQALAARAAAPKPEVHVYDGAYHGFDSRGPVRLRRDVPGGARPGGGVHVGGDAAAREASRAALQTFLKSMAPQ
jgi:dienelactone hydrolase